MADPLLKTTAHDVTIINEFSDSNQLIFQACPLGIVAQLVNLIFSISTKHSINQEQYSNHPSLYQTSEKLTKKLDLEIR